MVSASAHRNIHTGIGYTARCRKGKKGQAKVCPPPSVGNGFLKHRFLPLAAEGALNGRRERERKILTCIDNLAALYGFTALDVAAQPYPYNIHLAFRYAEKQVEQVDKSLHLLLLEEDNRISVATAKEVSTGTTLFYLPVYPLWVLLQDRQRKQEARLLLSVCAYLCQVAGVPYFDEYSPVLGQYEMLKEWMWEVDDFTDPTEREENLSLLNAAFYFGKRTGKQIKHPYHLEQFGNRLKFFKGTTPFGIALKKVAKSLFQLYRTYPQRSLMDRVHTGMLHPDEDQRIYMEQVVSFIWDENGWLGEQLLEMTSNQLNEMSTMDEPIAFQFFDTPQVSIVHDLQFETALIELLHELSDVLRMN